MSSADYRSLGDPELVSRCLNGDAQAWETLILRYKRLIYSVPVRFSFSAADAADVFQSVCVKLIENLHQLKDETKVSAWLITTTTRQCILMRNQRLRESSTDDEFEEPPDPAEDLEETQIQSQRDETVREAVRELPDRCRKLLEMLYFDVGNPSYEEISRKMQMPVPSIGPTRARCLAKLQTLLRRKGIR